MASGWKIAKYTIIAGAAIAVVGAFAGEQSVANNAPVAVERTGWGIGVGAKSATYAGPGIQRGFNQVPDPPQVP